MSFGMFVLYALWGRGGVVDWYWVFGDWGLGIGYRVVGLWVGKQGKRGNGGCDGGGVVWGGEPVGW